MNVDGAIPVGLSALEKLVENVAGELLEQWAINDRFTEEQADEAAQNAVNDVVFVINSYMIKFNELVALEQARKSNAQIQTN